MPCLLNRGSNEDLVLENLVSKKKFELFKEIEISEHWKELV